MTRDDLATRAALENWDFEPRCTHLANGNAKQFSCYHVFYVHTYMHVAWMKHTHTHTGRDRGVGHRAMIKRERVRKDDKGRSARKDMRKNERTDQPVTSAGYWPIRCSYSPDVTTSPDMTRIPERV